MIIILQLCMKCLCMVQSEEPPKVCEKEHAIHIRVLSQTTSNQSSSNTISQPLICALIRSQTALVLPPPPPPPPPPPTFYMPCGIVTMGYQDPRNKK